ncbi:hypothetical protein Hypma_005670 [Hypsizygus marmoreus]|uniref:Alpha-type protein kinase domain-containing protein n=1 Tax=Hypsizygus marmoreus TaxID=39966 RepID=A0A369K1D9_HYPMA|nr:hypothetical protein Hypma_005670 [Hypsizygus marmoreus]
MPTHTCISFSFDPCTTGLFPLTKHIVRAQLVANWERDRQALASQECIKGEPTFINWCNIFISRMTLCKTDTETEGCGLEFPEKTLEGLCRRCTALDALSPESDAYQATSQISQCLSCGVLWKHMPFKNLCGTCHRKPAESEAAGLVGDGVSAVNAHRSEAFAQRLKRPPTINQLAKVSAQPTLPLTTAGLDTFRNVGYNDADCIKVCVEARTNGKIDARLGTTSRAYPPNMLVDANTSTEVLENILTTLNPTWEKANSRSLQLSDIDLRMHGNQTIIPGSQNSTLQDFYEVHKRSASSEIYFGKLPKMAACLKGKVLAIELWIDTSAYEERTGQTAISSAAKGKRKATGHRTTVDVTAKRPRVSLNLETTFKRRSALSVEDGNTISLKLAHVNVDPEECDPTISWDASETKSAIIASSIFKSGKMKNCYKVVMDDKEYVAKCFFEIGNGIDKVTPAENAKHLMEEVERCEYGRWFLHNFRTSAAEMGVEVADNIEFTQCFLAEELLPAGTSPSVASGLDEFDDPVNKIIWFLEPLRHTAVVRWSGTLQHPDHKGKLAQTLAAFVHYAYSYSEGTLVFADLQGSKGTLSNGKSGMVLFDVMTHSPNGMTGVGDHGPEGVKCWREQHVCREICEGLKLESGEDDGEDNEE